ncbi:MAG TPA: amidase [Bryobacteraceae bacterium]|nr:amidase [Bryobacteraceae bacterium]
MVTRRSALLLSAAALAQPKREELCFLSAIELQRRLRARQLSATELLEAHLRQIAKANAKCNAIVTLVEDQARATAARADEAAAKGKFLGPLHGLPIAHKDLQETKGIRTTFGSPLFRDNIPTRDTLLIERIRAAGAVTLGKTNTPEFGAGSQTFNPVFGATRNPYDLSKTCGGSSGGAAAALAARMLPIADGSDTGGSLRNPAAFCGVVGFRPSPGRVPSGPNWNPLSVVGPMARSVADTALLLSAIAGPDPRYPLSLPEPGARFGLPLDRLGRGVRVAWGANLLGLPFHRDVRKVFFEQRKVFELLGCQMADAEPDLTDADDIFKVFRALGFYQQHAEKVARHRDSIKSTVLEEVDRGAALKPADIVRADAARTRLHIRVGEFFARHDYFVLPTTQVAAFDVDQPYIREIEGVSMGSYIDWMRSCYYITVMAVPAISLPCGFTPDGLPVGLQIVGKPKDDGGVLQLAHAFEKARNLGRIPEIAG